MSLVATMVNNIDLTRDSDSDEQVRVKTPYQAYHVRSSNLPGTTRCLSLFLVVFQFRPLNYPQLSTFFFFLYHFSFLPLPLLTCTVS